MSRLLGFTRSCSAGIALATTLACSVSESTERELGAYEAAYIDSVAPLIRDTAITGYIGTLGRSLTSRTGRANLDWRFTVVNSSVANAMALPGGFVYVTRGLIEQSSSLDELAGVMAHEIGHVVRRHSIKQVTESGKAAVALLMFCTITRVCTTPDGAAALQVGANAADAQHSQHDEAEADSAAVVITVAAGIDPRGFPAFLETVLAGRTERPTIIDAFFASHPTEEARIWALRWQIARLPRSRGELRRDTRAFHAIQARIRALPPPPNASNQNMPTGGVR